MYWFGRGDVLIEKNDIFFLVDGMIDKLDGYWKISVNVIRRLYIIILFVYNNLFLFKYIL